MPTHIITIYRDRKKEWRWRLTRKRGGKIVADSAEGYKTYYGVVRAVAHLPIEWLLCKLIDKGENHA